MQDTQAVRARLMAKHAELEERLRRIDRDLRRREEPLAADFSEQAVEQENLDTLYGIEKEAGVEIKKVEQALERLARDEYDVCSRCGRPIGAARLAALPYADTCIDCAD